MPIGHARCSSVSLLVGVLIVVDITACGTRIHVSGPDRPLAPLVWERDPICVVQPADARSAEVIYFGSGALVANRIARVILRDRHVKAIRLEDDATKSETCAARRGTGLVLPVILDWQRERGVLVSREDVKIRLSLLRVGASEPMRTVEFELKGSRLNVLFSPPDLLPVEFDEAVRRLLAPG